MMIKDAAKMLDMNYSTAKTILRVHRLNNRILRVNQEKKFEIFKVIPIKNSDDILDNSADYNTLEKMLPLEFKIENRDERFSRIPLQMKNFKSDFSSTETEYSDLMNTRISFDKFVSDNLSKPPYAECKNEEESSTILLFSQYLTLINQLYSVQAEIESNSKIISNFFTGINNSTRKRYELLGNLLFNNLLPK
jgi:hypothetical protein